jgi:hypothetical protein
MKNSRLEKAFLALAGIGALVSAVDVFAQSKSSQNSEDQDGTAAIANDGAVNTNVNRNGADCSGIVGLTADSSGIAGWYAEPAELASQVTGAQSVYESRIAGDVLAVLTDTRLTIYKLGEKGTIPQLEETLTIAPGSRSLAVSPLGQEIALSGSEVRFFRKSATGWQSAGQVIVGVSEAEYSPDGLELAMTTTPGTVRIATRAIGGDWELGQSLSLPKPDPSFGQNIVWLQTRLLISSSTVTNSYAKSAGLWGFVQAIPVNSQISGLRRVDGFYHSPASLLARYDFVPIGFGAVTPLSPIGAGVLVRGLNPTFAAKLVPATPGTTCATVPAFVVSTNPYLQNFNLLFFPEPGFPRHLEFEERGAVAVIQTSPVLSKIYFIAPDRIFGGNIPPPDRMGGSQGGFESR